MSAASLASQYGQLQQPRVGPDIMAAPVQPPPFNFQMPPMLQPQKQSGLAQGIGAIGGKVLGKYLNKPQAQAGTGEDMLIPQAARGVDAPVAAYAAGGNWDRYLGMPVEFGEDGPEKVIGQDGTTQTVGQNGPEVMIPQKPGTVIPASQTAQSQYTPYQWMGDDSPRNVGPSSVVMSAGNSATAPPDTGPPPLSANGYGDETATRPRLAVPVPPTADAGGNMIAQERPNIVNMPDFLRKKISDLSTGVTGGPTWGSGQQSVDADGKVIKAPGRGHAALANARNAMILAQSQSPDWRRTFAAGVTGLVTGAVDPKDAQLADQRMTAGQDQLKLNQLDANEQARLAEGLKQAQIAGQYGNIGYKELMGQVAVQKANTGDENADTRATRVASQNKTDTGNLAVRQDRAKTYATKSEADAELKERRIREPHVKTVQDVKSGKWFVINTDRESGVSTASGVGDGSGGQFGTTAPHMLRLDEIEARANAAAKNAKTAREAKLLGDQSRASSWDDAADEYLNQAKQAASTGNLRSAAAIRLKAVSAQQKADQYRGGPRQQQPSTQIQVGGGVGNQ